MAQQAVDTVYGWSKLATGTYVDPTQYGKTHINDVIASADRFSNWARGTSDGSFKQYAEDEANKYQNLSKLLAWFRDKSGCETMGDVLSKIEKREIDLSIIELWAHDYFQDHLPPCVLRYAVQNAYPEVAEHMRKVQEEAISAALARVRFMINDFSES